MIIKDFFLILNSLNTYYAKYRLYNLTRSMEIEQRIYLYYHRLYFDIMYLLSLCIIISFITHDNIQDLLFVSQIFLALLNVSFHYPIHFILNSCLLLILYLQNDHIIVIFNIYIAFAHYQIKSKHAKYLNNITATLNILYMLSYVRSVKLVALYIILSFISFIYKGWHIANIN